MSTAYRFSENDIPHFVTMTVVEWVDLFNRQRYKDIIVENLNFCIKNKGLIVHAYVIMSNHVHLIVRTRNGENLSSLIRDFKRYSAKVIYETLKQDQRESRKNWLLWIIESQGEMSNSNTHSKIWIHENHPIPLDRNNMFEERLNYIHLNPVRAGICFTPEDYVYSSAGAYAGVIGLVNVELV